jgi:hypothetical protein
MEDSFNVIMRCPKCGKDFPPDASYCEACSAMLEPYEIECSGPAEPAIAIPPEDKPLTASAETIEEAELDSLKADLENKFIFTILTEMEQLKKKLAAREKSLAELEAKEADLKLPDFLAKHRKAESEVEEIIVKTAKLETTIDNLGQKIETDIEVLESKVKELKDPGSLWFLKGSGRYYRMLSSELETKKDLLEVIQKKKSQSYLKTKQLRKIYILIGLTSLLSLTLSWSVFNYTYKGRISPSSIPAGQNAPQKKTEEISKNNILQVLEDIKKANLSKDLGLWESRYSRNYPELAKRKTALTQQWQKYNFKSLEYIIADPKIRPDSASASVTWDMEMAPVKSGDFKIITQRLYVNFILEDKRIKISSVKRPGR